MPLRLIIVASCHDGEGEDLDSPASSRLSVMEIASMSSPRGTSSSIAMGLIGPSKRKRSQSPTKDLINATHFNAGPPGALASSSSRKRVKVLRIEIPSSLNSGLNDQTTSTLSDSPLFTASPTTDSIFEDIDDIPSVAPLPDPFLAMRTVPPIPGLFFDPTTTIPQDLADSVMDFCMKTYFNYPGVNQVMLFGRPVPTPDTTSGLPPILLVLLDKLSVLLKPNIPPDTHSLLFPEEPTMARQAIINLYQPGEGITPHVDLLGRYGDGVIGVSFNSGSVMRFDKVGPPTVPSQDDSVHAVDEDKRWDLYLPERSIVALSEDARYHWTHGIEKKTKDLVSLPPVAGQPTYAAESEKGSWIVRGVRMSVTFRWLLPGADVVGDPEESA